MRKHDILKFYINIKCTFNKNKNEQFLNWVGVQNKQLKNCKNPKKNVNKNKQNLFIKYRF